MERPLRSVIEWLRAGYPDDAPRTGHSPLLALMGPISLTRRQLNDVVRDLGGQPATTEDIQVAITRVTGQLPSDDQTRAVRKALRES